MKEMRRENGKRENGIAGGEIQRQARRAEKKRERDRTREYSA